MGLKDADGMTYNADLNQTVPDGTVGSVLSVWIFRIFSVYFIDNILKVYINGHCPKLFLNQIEKNRFYYWYANTKYIDRESAHYIKLNFWREMLPVSLSSSH